MAIKYKLFPETASSYPRLFELIKLIFVYEFMVARPSDITNLPASIVEAGPS